MMPCGIHLTGKFGRKRSIYLYDNYSNGSYLATTAEGIELLESDIATVIQFDKGALVVIKLMQQDGLFVMLVTLAQPTIDANLTTHKLMIRNHAHCTKQTLL